MANWIITDNGTLIQIEHEGLEVFNNPKSDTEIKIVRAKTGDNTSSVDKLYIGFDTSWPCQINWNDVTVDGVAPTDVDDFSDKVEVVLNNVSSGSGLQSPITVDQTTAATMTAGVPSFPVDGQVYLINDLAITGIDHIRTVGMVAYDAAPGLYTFNSNCEAYVTALGIYVPCTYDVATNKIYVKVPVYAINLTQTDSGTTNTVNKTFTNLLGETPVITRVDDGVINFNTTTFTFVEHQTQVHPVMIYNTDQAALYTPVFSWVGANDIKLRMTKEDGSPQDDIYNNTYLEFYILIAN